ncbi:MAG: hypothetical protein AB7O73_04120 [Bacteroidia bacterium]
MKRALLIFLITSAFQTAFSFSDTLKNKFKWRPYLMWGYNREVYTNSTIRFQNNGDGVNEYGTYDFEIKDAKAHDRPDFHQIGDIVNLTIPQYNIRFGWWFNNERDEGFEISFDHTKYVVTNYQTARFVGEINGVHIDKDSILDPAYIHFEHTDGANFGMANYMRRFKLFHSLKSNFKLDYVIKPGLGIVVPKTDVTLFGNRINNKFKIAGVCAGFETSIRLEAYKHFVVEFAGKAGWANYINVFVQGKGNGKASHKFGYLEGILCIGYQI